MPNPSLRVKHHRVISNTSQLCCAGQVTTWLLQLLLALPNGSTVRLQAAFVPTVQSWRPSSGTTHDLARIPRERTHTQQPAPAASTTAHLLGAAVAAVSSSRAALKMEPRRQQCRSRADLQWPQPCTGLSLVTSCVWAPTRAGSCRGPPCTDHYSLTPLPARLPCICSVCKRGDAVICQAGLHLQQRLVELCWHGPGVQRVRQHSEGSSCCAEGCQQQHARAAGSGWRRVQELGGVEWALLAGPCV